MCGTLKCTRWSPPCYDWPAPDGEWGVVKVGCCNEFDVDISQQKTLPPDIPANPAYEIKDGDILMSRGNTLDLVGSAALAQEVRSKLLLSDLVYRFRVIEEDLDPAYLVHSLRSKFVRTQIEGSAVGSSSTMKKVSQELVRNLLVCRPSIQEQRKISLHLRDMNERLESLIVIAQDTVDLLQERRSALISAAVTGKIDVRDWRPPVSEEEVESEGAGVLP